MDSEINPAAKSKKRKYLSVIITVFLLLALILPIITPVVCCFLLPPVYDSTFLGVLGDKYDRLNSVDTPKIVVIGGSSVAFGLDSELMSEALGMEVVNFGLYASLGTKLMLDLSRSNINKGDIIIVAPELSRQTLSLYFNSETVMQALDGNFEMLGSVDGDNYSSLIGEMWRFSTTKLSYLVAGERPRNTGAYAKEYFNEYGDNVYARPYNTMKDITPSITLDFRVDKSDGETTEYEMFIDYLNEYIEYCNDKDATVYFSFAPMNEALLTEYNTEENIDAFYDNLSSSLNCRIISNIYEYIMDEGYFFDTEFHLNDSGVRLRTSRLVDDIRREWGVSAESIAFEGPSGYAPIDFATGSDVNLYYELELDTMGSQTVWYIKGLNAEGKRQVQLTVPNNVDGYPVAGIREAAFAGAQVRTLLLGDNIMALPPRCFSGAAHLSEIYVTKSDPTVIDIADLTNDGFATDGARDDVRIYVPEEALSEYKMDYSWGNYSEFLRGYKPNK